MNRKIDTESKIKTILEKTEAKLRLIAKDPDVLDYNYYNDSKFVGAKVMRNKKITLEQVAEDLATLSKTVADLTRIVIEGFTRQEVYNKKIDKIEADVTELKQDVIVIKRDLKEVRELPIIKEALKNSKKK